MLYTKEWTLLSWILRLQIQSRHLQTYFYFVFPFYLISGVLAIARVRCDPSLWRQISCRTIWKAWHSSSRRLYSIRLPLISGLKKIVYLCFYSIGSLKMVLFLLMIFWINGSNCCGCGSMVRKELHRAMEIQTTVLSCDLWLCIAWLAMEGIVLVYNVWACPALSCFFPKRLSLLWLDFFWFNYYFRSCRDQI